MNNKKFNINEPIEFLFTKFGFEVNIIKKIVTGKTYVAIMLNSGFIGISANLFDIKNINLQEIIIPDFSNNIHRVVLAAYYNAILNNLENESIYEDIFDVINFQEYNNIVMIGFSEPMYHKLKIIKVNPNVFDYSSNNSIVKSQSKQIKYLKDADCVILTATSIMNNTFFDIVNNAKDICDIFLFGPSTLISNELFKYKNVKGLFGTVFNKEDENILKVIEEGEGNRHLKKLGKKVGLLKINK